MQKGIGESVGGEEGIIPTVPDGQDTWSLAAGCYVKRRVVIPQHIFSSLIKLRTKCKESAQCPHLKNEKNERSRQPYPLSFKMSRPITHEEGPETVLHERERWGSVIFRCVTRSSEKVLKVQIQKVLYSRSSGLY